MENSDNFFSLLPDDVVNLIMRAVSDCKSLVRCMAVSKYFKQRSAGVSCLSIECPGQFSCYEEKLERIYSMVKEFRSLEFLIVRVGQPKSEAPSWASCMRYAEIGTSVEKFIFMAAKSGEFSDLDKPVGASQNSMREAEAIPSQSQTEISSQQGFIVSQEEGSGAVPDSLMSFNGSSESRQLAPKLNSLSAQKLDDKRVPEFSLRQVVAPSNNVLRKMVPVIVFAIIQGLDEFRDRVPYFIEKFYGLKSFLLVDLLESVTIYMREHQIQDVRAQPLRESKAGQSYKRRDKNALCENLNKEECEAENEDGCKRLEKLLLPKSCLSSKQKLSSGSKAESETWSLPDLGIQEQNFRENEVSAERGIWNKGKQQADADEHDFLLTKYCASVELKKPEKGKSRIHNVTEVENSSVWRSKAEFSDSESWHIGESSSSYYSESVDQGEQGNIVTSLTNSTYSENSNRSGYLCSEIEATVKDYELNASNLIQEECLTFDKGDQKVFILSEEFAVEKMMPATFDYQEIYPESTNSSFGNGQSKVFQSESVYKSPEKPLKPVNLLTGDCSAWLNVETNPRCGVHGSHHAKESSNIYFQELNKDCRHDGVLKHNFKKSSKYDSSRFREMDRLGRTANKIKDSRLEDGSLGGYENTNDKGQGLKQTCKPGMENSIKLSRDVTSKEHRDQRDMEGRGIQFIGGSCCEKQNKVSGSTSETKTEFPSSVQHSQSSSLEMATVDPATFGRGQETDFFSSTRLVKGDVISSTTLNYRSLAITDKLEVASNRDTKFVDDKLSPAFNLHSLSESINNTQGENPFEVVVPKPTEIATPPNRTQMYDTNQANKVHNTSFADDSPARNRCVFASKEKQEESIYKLERRGIVKPWHFPNDFKRLSSQQGDQIEDRWKRAIHAGTWRETWRESLRRRIRDQQRVEQRRFEADRERMMAEAREAEPERESEADTERERAEVRERQLDIEQEALSFITTFWRAELVSVRNYCLNDVSMCIATHAAKPLLAKDLDMLSKAALAGSLVAATVATVNNQVSSHNL